MENRPVVTGVVERIDIVVERGFVTSTGEPEAGDNGDPGFQP